MYDSEFKIKLESDISKSKVYCGQNSAKICKFYSDFMDSKWKKISKVDLDGCKRKIEAPTNQVENPSIFLGLTVPTICALAGLLAVVILHFDV